MRGKRRQLRTLLPTFTLVSVVYLAIDKGLLLISHCPLCSPPSALLHVQASHSLVPFQSQEFTRDMLKEVLGALLPDSSQAGHFFRATVWSLQLLLSAMYAKPSHLPFCDQETHLQKGTHTAGTKNNISWIPVQDCFLSWKPCLVSHSTAIFFWAGKATLPRTQLI